MQKGKNTPDVIIPDKEKSKLRMAPQIILPSHDEVPLRCGRCGKTSWGVLVKPTKDGGGAKISNLVCYTCQKAYEITPEGYIGGGGIYEVRNPKPKRPA